MFEVELNEIVLLCYEKHNKKEMHFSTFAFLQYIVGNVFSRIHILLDLNKEYELYWYMRARAAELKVENRTLHAFIIKPSRAG